MLGDDQREQRARVIAAQLACAAMYESALDAEGKLKDKYKFFGELTPWEAHEYGQCRSEVRSQPQFQLEDWRLFNLKIPNGEDTKQILVVAFRGTQFKDFNLQTFLESEYFRTGSRLHWLPRLMQCIMRLWKEVPADLKTDGTANLNKQSGFHTGFEKRSNDFLNMLGNGDEKNGAKNGARKLETIADGREILLVGHSLGGAIATIVLMKLHQYTRNPSNMRAITFASPLVFGSQALDNNDKGLQGRCDWVREHLVTFVYEKDFVPRILSWTKLQKLGPHLKYEPLGSYVFIGAAEPTVIGPEGRRDVGERKIMRRLQTPKIMAVRYCIQAAVDTTVFHHIDEAYGEYLVTMENHLERNQSIAAGCSSASAGAASNDGALSRSIRIEPSVNSAISCPVSNMPHRNDDCESDSGSSTRFSGLSPPAEENISQLSVGGSCRAEPEEKPSTSRPRRGSARSVVVKVIPTSPSELPHVVPQVDSPGGESPAPESAPPLPLRSAGIFEAAAREPNCRPNLETLKV